MLHTSFDSRREAAPGARLFVCGDIHGCLGPLNERLDAIGFDKDRDHLFALGDLVDRGPSYLRQLIHGLGEGSGKAFQDEPNELRSIEMSAGESTSVHLSDQIRHVRRGDEVWVTTVDDPRHFNVIGHRCVK